MHQAKLSADSMSFVSAQFSLRSIILISPALSWADENATDAIDAQAQQIFVLTLPLGNGRCAVAESGWPDENAVDAAISAGLSAHSPSGRVGLSSSERANRFRNGCDTKRRIKPSPAATASDPPSRGRVMNVWLFEDSYRQHFH